LLAAVIQPDPAIHKKIHLEPAVSGSNSLVYDSVGLDAVDGHLLLSLTVTAVCPLHRHDCKRTAAMTSTSTAALLFSLHAYCCWLWLFGLPYLEKGQLTSLRPCLA
jgi:hypothetical protein